MQVVYKRSKSAECHKGLLLYLAYHLTAMLCNCHMLPSVSVYLDGMNAIGSFGLQDRDS